MEENLNPEEDGDEEFEELEFDTDNPIFVFCFMFMEYIKEMDLVLYDKAHKYANDHSDLNITDFEILMNDFKEDTQDVEEEEQEEKEYGINYDDENYGEED